MHPGADSADRRSAVTWPAECIGATGANASAAAAGEGTTHGPVGIRKQWRTARAPVRARWTIQTIGRVHH